MQIPPLISERLLLRAQIGSHAYGTSTPTSDTDFMEVVAASDQVYLSLDWFGSQGTLEKKEKDEAGNLLSEQTSYELTKFLRLCQNFNPNVIPLLWVSKFDHVDPLGQVIIDNRHIFNSKRAIDSFAGYAYRQLEKMGADSPTTGRMGAKRKDLRDKYGFDCYVDAETKFLTHRGWQRWDDISENDRLGTVNPITGRLEYQPYLQRFEKTYHGPISSFSFRGFKAATTINHHMLVSECHRNPSTGYSYAYFAEQANWRLVSVSDLLESPRSWFHYRRSLIVPEVPIAEDRLEWLRLAGMFLSDGTVTFHPNGSFKCIRFTQSYDNEFSAILDAQAIALKMNVYCYGQERIWDWYGDDARRIYDEFGHAEDKHLPGWCFALHPAEARALWEGCVLGDGSVYRRKLDYEVVYSANEWLASDLHAMLTASGISATLLGPYDSVTSFGPCRMYHVRRSDWQQPIGALNTNKIDVDLAERVRVVCFQTPNQTLVTLNNGCVSLHGNTKYMYHAVRLARMIGEFFRCNGAVLLVDRRGIDAEELIAIRNGAWTYDQGRAEILRLLEESKASAAASTLPDEPDKQAIRDLARFILRKHLGIGTNAEQSVFQES